MRASSTRIIITDARTDGRVDGVLPVERTEGQSPVSSQTQIKPADALSTCQQAMLLLLLLMFKFAQFKAL